MEGNTNPLAGKNDSISSVYLSVCLKLSFTALLLIARVLLSFFLRRSAIRHVIHIKKKEKEILMQYFIQKRQYFVWIGQYFHKRWPCPQHAALKVTAALYGIAYQH